MEMVPDIRPLQPRNFSLLHGDWNCLHPAYPGNQGKNSGRVVKRTTGRIRVGYNLSSCPNSVQVLKHISFVGVRDIHLDKTGVIADQR